MGSEVRRLKKKKKNAGWTCGLSFPPKCSPCTLNEIYAHGLPAQPVLQFNGDAREVGMMDLDPEYEVRKVPKIVTLSRKPDCRGKGQKGRGGR